MQHNKSNGDGQDMQSGKQQWYIIHGAEQAEQMSNEMDKRYEETNREYMDENNEKQGRLEEIHCVKCGSTSQE